MRKGFLKGVVTFAVAAALALPVAGFAADAGSGAAQGSATGAGNGHGAKRQHEAKDHAAHGGRGKYREMKEKGQLKPADVQKVESAMSDLKTLQKNRPNRSSTPEQKKAFRDSLKQKRIAVNDAMEAAVKNATPAQASTQTTGAPAGTTAK